MTDDPGRVLFSTFLSEHRSGLADDGMTDALAEVADAVLRTRKPGSVTLTLKLTAEGDMLAVVDTCSAKVPEEPDPRLYWRDLAGNLTRNNPVQPRLPGADPYSPPTVDPETGEVIR